MEYECIICGSLWRIDYEIEKGNDGLVSSGLCKACLRDRITPLVHKEQLEYSQIPCYATAKGYCDQASCRYMDSCLEIKVLEWECEVNLIKGDGK